MVRKFFPLDKNYLLEASQLRLEDQLLRALVANAKVSYQLNHNPLGLNDEFSVQIAQCYVDDLKPLHAFYLNLSGVYRYKFGENQLGFLWDGKDHAEKYEEDWKATFEEWTTRLCTQIQFVQAVLDLTVFFPEDDRHAHLAENRMNAVMTSLFELKIHKNRGIVEMKVA